MGPIYLIPPHTHIRILSSLFLTNMFCKAKDMFCKVWYGVAGGGALAGPVLKHPSPLRYQSQNRIELYSSLEQSLFGSMGRGG